MKGLYCPKVDFLSDWNQQETHLSNLIATGRAGTPPRWSHLYNWALN